jgi:hypothetical protein
MADPKLQRDDDDEPFDPDRREMCSDGMCVGVIGPDGRCKVCGKPGSGAPPAAKPKAVAPDAPGPAGAGDWHPAAVPEAGDDDGDDGGEASEPPRDEPPAAGKPDFERTRVPCSDDLCTGVIGRNGRCGTCGKPWSGSDG